MRANLTQSQRAIALLIDVLALLAISYVAFGSFAPPLGDDGFWFYTALLGVLMGTKLAFDPFLCKTRRCRAHMLCLLYRTLRNDWGQWQENGQIAFIVSTTITVLIGGCAFTALLLNGWNRPRVQEVSNRLRILVEGIATPQVLCSPIMIFAMLAYHYGTTKGTRSGVCRNAAHNHLLRQDMPDQPCSKSKLVAVWGSTNQRFWHCRRLPKAWHLPVAL
ncbi:MAG: hypothetical protein U5K56_09885 [Halioglobus sp.]|nr:hypothetical protein [Halioglobus sp.]